MVHLIYLIVDFIVRGLIVILTSLIIHKNYGRDDAIDKQFNLLNISYAFVVKLFKIRVISIIDDLLLGFCLGYLFIAVLKGYHIW